MQYSAKFDPCNYYHTCRTMLWFIEKKNRGPIVQRLFAKSRIIHIDISSIQHTTEYWSSWNCGNIFWISRDTQIQAIVMKYVHIIFVWKNELRASMHHSDHIFHTLRYVDMSSLRYSRSGIAIMYILSRADSRLAPSQWETSIQSKAVSLWLGANRESAL